MTGEQGVHASMFGCNTYSFMRSHSAETCLARLTDQGFREFELMVHPGHLWAAELSTEQRNAIRRLLAQRGLQLTALNVPNIDINVAAAAPEMRAYSLNLLSETVRLAGELGARGVVIGPGKANPLFPADASELIGHFLAALDQLCPVAEKSGTALWVENMPFAFLPAIGPLMDALTRYGNDAVRVVYDVANAYFIGEDFAMACKNAERGLHWCICRTPAGKSIATIQSVSAPCRSREYQARLPPSVAVRRRCWRSFLAIPTATLSAAPANSRY